MLIGATAVIVNAHGQVLLVRHTYGRRHWDLPGGHAEPGEAADATAVREVGEETRLRVEVERLTGVYYEPEADIDMHHFVFACRLVDEAALPVPDRREIADCGFWALEALPRPINDFTIRRIEDAIGGRPVTAIVVAPPRRWLTS